MKSLSCCLILALGLFACRAQARPPASLVIDAATGEVLHAEQASQRWYPASLTKMMTIYLTFKALEAGSLHLHDTLTASAHAAAQPDSRLGLRKGDRISVKEAILAVISQSANDVAVVLAERLGGTETHFAELMTAEAHELGMSRTVFRTATGLPNNEQITTAHDMAVLALALIRQFPQYYHFFGARYFRYKGIPHSSINAILRAYAGADGLKTGFTCGSGFNLVASAKRNDRRLIGVVLGASSTAERTAAMIHLLNAGFAAKPADPMLLASLQTPSNDRHRPPPFRLKASQCRIGTGIRGREARGTLPGWGLLFGVFHDQDDAMRYLNKMRAELQPVIRRAGRPALVKRQVEDTITWKALVVGLSQNDAIKACLHLIKGDNICLVQSPKVLNPPARHHHGKSGKRPHRR
jgi:D-alanyl-D-alanine carboxypeptidase